MQTKGILIFNLVENSQPMYMIAFLFLKQACDLKCLVVVIITIIFKIVNSANCGKMHILAKRINKRER